MMTGMGNNTIYRYLTLLTGLWAIYACAAPRSQSTRMAAEPLLPVIDFTIQVGAFSTPQRAARYAQRMRQKNLDAYYFIDADNLYKVRFGRYESKQAARSHARQLQMQADIEDYYIVRPRVAGSHSHGPADLRHRLVMTAQRFVGSPYRWGGTSPATGFDCSGLTMTVYRLNGMHLPRQARDQFQRGTPIERKSLRPGDLVFFATGTGRRVTHVGIYSGQDRFIHAPGWGKRIGSADLDHRYYAQRYRGARRYY
jgi:cell wall-associated NlpC family hydrolase